MIAEKIDYYISEYKDETKNSIFWKGNVEKFQDNDCSLFFEGDSIKEFSIRFDIRNKENTEKFVELILQLAAEHKLKFMNLKYRFFEAQKDLLLKDIIDSNANKFLNNPEEFLKSLTDNKQ